jgi:CubicO group peptidase (beta-lactamase class C family)
LQQKRFDLASVTKPLGVGVLAMQAVSRGVLDLDRQLFPDLPQHLTARALLGHRAGLPPWKAWVDALPPGFRAGTVRTRFALEALVRQAARDSNPAQGAVYSDIGYMLLHMFFEQTTGRRLRELVPGFRPPRPARDPDAFVGCGMCPVRRRARFGEVHDPQAWAFGGAAGHAGLFATPDEVGQMAVALVETAAGRPQPVGAVRGLAPEVVRHFWAPEGRPDGWDSTWALAWDRPSPGASSAGRSVAKDAIGHLGFTGTSLWIEPSRALVMVLLTNRVALGDAAQARLRAFRPLFHDAVRALLALGDCPAHTAMALIPST